MKVSQLIPESNICIGWPGEDIPRTRTKWKLLPSMIELLAKKENFSKETVSTIIQTVLNREKSMSTGIGQGLAIPHSGIDSINKPVGNLIILKDGLDFESLDKEDVFVIFLVLLPLDNYQKHIQILSNILFILGKSGWREELLEATTASEARNILVQLEE